MLNLYFYCLTLFKICFLAPVRYAVCLSFKLKHFLLFCSVSITRLFLLSVPSLPRAALPWSPKARAPLLSLPPANLLQALAVPPALVGGVLWGSWHCCQPRDCPGPRLSLAGGLAQVLPPAQPGWVFLASVAVGNVCGLLDNSTGFVLSHWGENV